MDIHDAHTLALLVVGRRDEEGEVEADRQSRHGADGCEGQEPVGKTGKTRRIGEAMHGCFPRGSLYLVP